MHEFEGQRSNESMCLICEPFKQSFNDKHYTCFNPQLLLLSPVHAASLLEVEVRVLLAGSSEGIEE